jgi:RimJ/RimL family protein N-acetyltransferase
MAPTRPPRRIETERLVLRPLDPDEAQLLQDAIDASLPELKRWMPWAAKEPKPVEETRRYIEASREAFDAGEAFVYPILSADEREVVGSTGIHTRCGDGAVEIGYWIRTDRTGLGYATEITRALTRIGLSLDGVERVVIECDAGNHRSRRIPERLGYTLVERRVEETAGADGVAAETLLYEIRDPGIPDRDGRA